MTRGGYSLRDITDFDDGPTPDEFITIYRLTMKHLLELRAENVNTFALAIGGLLDKKLFGEFRSKIDRALKALDAVKPSERLNDRREKMVHTMRELSKLNSLLGAG